LIALSASFSLATCYKEFQVNKKRRERCTTKAKFFKTSHSCTLTCGEKRPLKRVES